MVISIPPGIIAIIVIILCNCIISFAKNRILYLCNIVISSIFAIVGLAGIVITRIRFVESLNKNANTRNFDSDFVSWAIEKFDSFAVVSIAATCSVLLFFILYLAFNKKKVGFIWTNTTIIIISIMIINFIAGVWYGLKTINKLFDVAGYISQLTAFEFFILHSPLVVKKFLMRKK